MELKPVYAVMVCIPNEGKTEPSAYDNRLLWAFKMGMEEERMRREAITPRYEFYFSSVGRILTPYAREILAEYAVKMNVDLIFMIDDDMLGPSDTFFKLAANVVTGPADICGALAFTRNPPHDPVLYTSVEGFDPVEGPYFINQPVRRYPKDKLVETDAVGFGAVVFKAALLSQMKRPWFMSTTGTGEDIFFCYKAKKEANARVFSDTRVKLGHIGHPHIITEEVYEAWNAMPEKRGRDGDEVKYAWETLR